MKRLLLLTLSLLMIFLMLPSCKNNTESPQETTPVTQPPPDESAVAETVSAPVIPDELKGSGKTLRIYMQGWFGYTPLDVIDIGVTEDDGNLISSGAYQRDLRIENELGVYVEVTSEPECYNSFNTLLVQSFVGLEYELLLLRSAVYTKAVVNGMLLNLENPRLNHMDTDKPWWNSGSYEALSVCNKYFGICGDFTVSDDMTLWALFFNKDISAAMTNTPNPYDLVNNGTWTYEELWKMAVEAASDNDGTPGMTYEDTWGVTYLRDTVSGMINSVGIQFGEKDEDGVPFLSLYNDQNATKILDIFDLLYHTDVCYNIHARGGDEVKIFTDGRALFTFGGIYYAPQMRETESNVNFGILPYPKYNTAQTNYISSVSPLFLTVLCVPASNTVDLELRSMFMEEYSYLGNQLVVPEFYDKLLMGRIAKDEETAEIINFIFGNIAYDIGNIFNFGDLAFRIIDMTMTSDRKLTSVYGQYESPAQTAIDELVLKLQ